MDGQKNGQTDRHRSRNSSLDFPPHITLCKNLRICPFAFLKCETNPFSKDIGDIHKKMLVFFDNLIKFDQVWFILDGSDQKKILKNPAISILSVNMTTFYSIIFWLVRKSYLFKFNQVWSIFDGSDPKKSKIKEPFLSFS